MKALKSICILVVFLSFMTAGCTKPDAPGQGEIPEYPGAKEDQEHDAKVLGMTLGNVKRVVTSDSFDEVLAFYRERLEFRNPKIVSHTLEDGRQTAITISETKTGSKTVAIQEFKKEGLVAITYMKVGF